MARQCQVILHHNFSLPLKGGVILVGIFMGDRELDKTGCSSITRCEVIRHGMVHRYKKSISVEGILGGRIEMGDNSNKDQC